MALAQPAPSLDLPALHVSGTSAISRKFEANLAFRPFVSDVYIYAMPNFTVKSSILTVKRLGKRIG